MLDEGQLLGHEQRVSGPVERMLYLKRLPVVGTLPAPQLALVAEQMGERFFKKGSVLLRQGEPVAALYFVLRGAVLWADVALMAAGSIAGGLWGAALAQRLGRRLVRQAVIAIGVAASASLVLKFLG